MGNHLIRNGGWTAAAILIGLFAGRLLSESLRPQPAGALLITLGTISVSIAIIFLLTRRWENRPDATLLITTLPLLVYILYPEVDWQIAAAVGAVTLLAAGFFWRPDVGLNGKMVTAGWYILAGGGFFLLYFLTLAPDLLPADNGEFQLVATTLGVAHPPGFPLYTLLAHIMTRLPVGPTPAYRVNLFAAFTAVATLLLVMSSVQKLTHSRPAGLVAAIALGTATTFWAQATTANIRSLTAFFTALSIFALVNLREQVQQGVPRSSAYLLFGLSLGFGLTHHPSLLFMGIIFLVYLLLLDPTFLRQPRRWPPLLIGSLLGLLPLLYLPLRAGADVPGASLALATWPGFLDHVLARGFQGDFFAFTSPADLGQRLAIMGNVLTFQFHGLLLLAALVGFLWLLSWDRKLALLFGGSFAVHTLVTAIYRAPQTVEYMLPAYIPLAITIGLLVHRLLEIRSLSRPVTALGALMAATILVTTLAQGVTGWPSYRSLHTDTTARDYADSLLAPAPANSLLLSDWHWVTPLWYRQIVEGARPDVEIQYVFPESDPYAQTWSRRIREGLIKDREVIATHFEPQAYALLPRPEPLAEAFWFSQQPRTTLPEDFMSIDISFGDTIQVLGYDVAPETAALDAELVLTLAWQPVPQPFPPANLQTTPWSLFAHLVGFDGQVVAQADLPALDRPEGITLTQFRLTPRPGAAPGEYALAIGAYLTADGTPLLDQTDEPRTILTTTNIGPQVMPPYTQQPASRVVVSGRPLLKLVGYDWDHTIPGRVRLYRHWQTEAGYQTEVLDITEEQPTLPAWFGPWGQLRAGTTLPERGEQHYVPLGDGIVWTGPAALAGENLTVQEQITLPAEFGAARPVLRDRIVSMRLVGYEPDGFFWAWTDLHDGVPALGAIPTLKWVRGSRVRDPHPLTVAPTATPGQEVGGILRLYDAFTNRPVPILDEDILTNYLGIPLGDAVITE